MVKLTCRYKGWKIVSKIRGVYAIYKNGRNDFTALTPSLEAAVRYIDEKSH